MLTWYDRPYNSAARQRKFEELSERNQLVPMFYDDLPPAQILDNGSLAPVVLNAITNPDYVSTYELRRQMGWDRQTPNPAYMAFEDWKAARELYATTGSKFWFEEMLHQVLVDEDRYDKVAERLPYV